jgi:DNA invertase Pin-like site-specific DNA recombinase
MSVYGYCRVSTAKQVSEGESLDVQRRQIEGYVHMRGLTIRGVTVEEGVSGSIPVHERAVRQAPKGRCRYRAEARPLVPLGARRAASRGGPAQRNLGGDISGNGLSKLFLTIAAAFAEAERDRTRERIGQVKADQKARGRYLGGIVPFGYRRGEHGQLTPHKAEQAAIRQMAALRAQRKALRAIAEAMQAKGFKISNEGVKGVLAAHNATA